MDLASWKDQTIAIHFAMIKTSSSNNFFILLNNIELMWFEVKKLYGVIARLLSHATPILLFFSNCNNLTGNKHLFFLIILIHTWKNVPVLNPMILVFHESGFALVMAPLDHYPSEHLFSVSCPHLLLTTWFMFLVNDKSFLTFSQGEKTTIFGLELI